MNLPMHERRHSIEKHIHVEILRGRIDQNQFVTREPVVEGAFGFWTGRRDGQLASKRTKGGTQIGMKVFEEPRIIQNKNLRGLNGQHLHTPGDRRGVKVNYTETSVP